MKGETSSCFLFCIVCLNSLRFPKRLMEFKPLCQRCDRWEDELRKSRFDTSSLLFLSACLQAHVMYSAVLLRTVATTAVNRFDSWIGWNVPPASRILRSQSHNCCAACSRDCLLNFWAASEESAKLQRKQWRQGWWFDPWLLLSPCGSGARRWRALLQLHDHRRDNFTLSEIDFWF